VAGLFGAQKLCVQSEKSIRYLAPRIIVPLTKLIEGVFDTTITSDYHTPITT
jgi:hypothetical protein